MLVFLLCVFRDQSFELQQGNRASGHHSNASDATGRLLNRYLEHHLALLHAHLLHEHATPEHLIVVFN
jgi:hypothetical protein